MNKNEELKKYYDRCAELIKYNPSTGEMNWKNSGRGIKKGGLVGSVKSDGYIGVGASIDKKFKLLKAHRIAWFIFYKELPNVIDHINGDRADNRITNLRNCTQQENTRNQKQKKGSKSKYKGVSWNKILNKWQSKICVNNLSIHLGYFNKEEQASEAYEVKAKEIFKEFKYEQR